jgi:hypothetical protein
MAATRNTSRRREQVKRDEASAPFTIALAAFLAYDWLRGE